MLPRVTVMQVGDVHLARTAKLGRPMDDKDRRFPVDLRHLLGTAPVKVVFRALHRLLEKGEVNLLLFMGDFAEQGDLGGYRACVRYLAEALQLGKGRRFADLPLGVVPGNHDVDRNLAARPGLKTKFQPLQQALADEGLPAMPVDAPVWVKTSIGPCRVDAALLNSCWGCGSKEFIPEEFRAEIARAIDTAIGAGGDSRVIQAYYDRQLDTPAFSGDTVQRLVEEASALPGGSLMLAVAHHNILPQRLPRLAPYTELVNSGAMRNALSGLNRPVVYLHGHIHEDPIEIIQPPGGAPLVSISAPEVSKGFNQLDLIFTPTGLPLTCSIRPWRFDDSGIFRAGPRRVIPIGAGRRRPPTPVIAAIYERVVADHDCYWVTLYEIARSTGAAAPENATEEALEMLAADQLVTIDNYDIGREHWMVRSKL